MYEFYSLVPEGDKDLRDYGGKSDVLIKILWL